MSATTTTTATTVTTPAAVYSVVASGTARSTATLRPRGTKRRLSTPSSVRPPIRLCTSLPPSLEALDLSSASPTQTLASLRFLVLSYLADLERRLNEFESPDFEAWGELKIEEATQWARTALEMLKGIRADVCSHLPEFHFADLSSVESFVRSHLPDLPDMAEMRSHLPDMPQLPDMTEMRSRLPDMEDVRSHLSDMRHKLDDVRTRFHELDFSYIPKLSDHLENLHSHLSKLEVPAASFKPNNGLFDLLESLLNSDIIKDILDSTQDVADAISEGEDILDWATHEVGNAIRRSFEGMHLINYSDLPQQWRNNPFVTYGYRFIPLERWPLIVMSLFALHNETLNIHTHLIPFLFWAVNLIPLFNDTYASDAAELLFMSFALLCLLCSALWHTMSGCADHRSMELCARVDYVGIGWLISASVATIVHYGFQCHPHIGHAFLGLCLATGIAGNIFPFMKWFNMHEYRFHRMGFFITLAFSAIGPMVALSLLHSRQEMFAFVAPVFPSLISYLVGLAFYAAHFPERILPDNIRRRLDMIGGGSHAIWHCFIVLAVSQHKQAIVLMREHAFCSVL
ncbi:hypothetical protein NLJ89_g8525 [Agrocybe chaxingu]|uniref:HlyIII-domain-containing protein n=1 Tax=Agrocybe chaxingu TaxID=84603 RepID=A0A9W8MU04_9AGAR|nr:hypothetical protein NLJ89_g8525 [Agrocybe chaxingu]